MLNQLSEKMFRIPFFSDSLLENRIPGGPKKTYYFWRYRGAEEKVLSKKFLLYLKEDLNLEL